MKEKQNTKVASQFLGTISFPEHSKRPHLPAYDVLSWHHINSAKGIQYKT